MRCENGGKRVKTVAGLFDLATLAGWRGSVMHVFLHHFHSSGHFKLSFFYVASLCFKSPVLE